MVNIVKLIILYVPYWAFQILYTSIAFIINQVWNTIYKVFYYILYFVPSCILNFLYSTLYYLYNGLYYLCNVLQYVAEIFGKALWIVIQFASKMLAYLLHMFLDTFNKIKGVIKNDHGTKSTFLPMDLCWVFLFIVFFAVTFVLANKKVKSTVRQSYIGAICVILPFFMMQSEFKIQSAQQKMLDRKMFNSQDSELNLDERKYVLGQISLKNWNYLVIFQKAYNFTYFSKNLHI